MTLVWTATPINATKPNIDETLKLVPVSHNASKPPTGSVIRTLNKMIISRKAKLRAQFWSQGTSARMPNAVSG